MIGDVSTRSIYIEPDIDCGLPNHCCVVAVSQLLYQPLTQAVEVPVEYAVSSLPFSTGIHARPLPLRPTDFRDRFAPAH